VGLGGKEDRRPATLSGGERQRLALVRALASNPRRLLLDEPFTSLDLELRLGLCELVDGLQLSYGFTLLLVTHDPLEAVRLADRIVVLEPGRLVWDGPAEHFLSVKGESPAGLSQALERWIHPRPDAVQGRRK
ncbi:MAG: ATP-binding cassette domain-containing protein, partial [Deltaproteobacteria bacterium]